MSAYFRRLFISLLVLALAGLAVASPARAQDGVPALTVEWSDVQDLGRDGYSVVLHFDNLGTGDAENIYISAVTMNGQSPTNLPLPYLVGSVDYGFDSMLTLIFPSTAGAPGSSAAVAVIGSFMDPNNEVSPYNFSANLTLAPPSAAKSYSEETLHSLDLNSPTGDLINPDSTLLYELNGGLVFDNQGVLYGTTYTAGQYYIGSIYKWDSVTGQFTTLFSFPDDAAGYDINGNLVFDSQGNLYGTAKWSNIDGGGVIFKYNPYSNQFAQLYIFSSDGVGNHPNGGFIMDNLGNLYGTTAGPNGNIFQYNIADGMLTTLYGFTDGADGDAPQPVLCLDNQNNLYATTEDGGTGVGTIFWYNLDTSQWASLYFFTDGSDGAYPNGGLIADSQGNLYGTTTSGGTTASGGSGSGTIFEFTPSTKQLTTLYTFTGGNDGGGTNGGLVFDSEGNLYGTAGGGSARQGVAFRFDPSTGQLTTLYSFSGMGKNTPVGALPLSGLTFDNLGNLYGVADLGGLYNDGILYELQAISSPGAGGPRLPPMPHPPAIPGLPSGLGSLPPGD